MAFWRNVALCASSSRIRWISASRMRRRSCRDESSLSLSSRASLWVVPSTVKKQNKNPQRAFQTPGRWYTQSEDQDAGFMSVHVICTVVPSTTWVYLLSISHNKNTTSDIKPHVRRSTKCSLYLYLLSLSPKLRSSPLSRSALSSQLADGRSALAAPPWPASPPPLSPALSLRDPGSENDMTCL